MTWLQALAFDVDFHGESKGEGVSWRGDRLLNIVKIENYQDDLFGEGKVVSTSWAIRAGQWACVWFSSETRLYIGRMAKVLLSLGSRGKRLLAQKIGQRILLLSQVCQPRGEVTIFVQKLLAYIGDLVSPSKRDRHWASRLRSNLEEALRLLEKLEVFESVEWPDGFGPNDIDRSKGWVDLWLQSKIQIRANLGPRRLGECRERRVAKKSTAATKRITVGDIRAARNNIIPMWSQQELALELGISRPYLSQIERGEKKPSGTLSKKIHQFIDRRNSEANG